MVEDWYTWNDKILNGMAADPILGIDLNLWAVFSESDLFSVIIL